MQRQIRLSLILISLSLALCSASAAFANPLAAKQDGTQVTELPQNGSQVIAVLQAGEVVQSVARKGMFWQVKLQDGKLGYVSVTRVQRHRGEAASLSQAIRQAAVEGREAGDDITTSRMRTAVMGVRGLDEDQDTAAAGNVKPNMDLVYRMEDRRVEQDRVGSLESRLQSEIEQRIRMRHGH